ncbi:hypothetical protein GQ600_17878 [Phytophthora cactorum]|nr:hypothetical protein GQ600_17878 [Phytophthora cactorum]
MLLYTRAKLAELEAAPGVIAPRLELKGVPSAHRCFQPARTRICWHVLYRHLEDTGRIHTHVARFVENDAKGKRYHSLAAVSDPIAVPPTRGQKKLYNESRLIVIVHRYVTYLNNAAKLVTAQLICKSIFGNYHKWQEHILLLALKAGMQAWLIRHRFDIEPTSFIPQLLELINAPKTRTTYVASRIAQSTSTHFYTRPRTSRNSNLLKWHGAYLSSELTTELARIKSKRWSKYYKSVMRLEDKYRADIEECELIDDEKRCEVGDGEDGE